MNKANGNMYEFVTHTWNPIKGKCPHQCSYCYMNSLNKRYGITPKELYLNEKELKANLGRGNTIFVGSSCDMWADDVPDLFIYEALKQAKNFPENKYLFQSKKPIRFLQFADVLPQNCCIGATIETNRIYPCMGKTPTPIDRGAAIDVLRKYERFITIEPILDFDIEEFLTIIKNANPGYINIGADSGNNRLPEPEPGKIRELIKELQTFTKVNLKKNLKRLLPEVNNETNIL